MFFHFLYQISNIILIIIMVLLLRYLFIRLERYENRYLFLAVIGLGIDLAAWYGMSHLSTVDGGMFTLRISMEGRMLFGIGFLGYLHRMYKPKLSKVVDAVWALNLIGCFFHTYSVNENYQYLKNPHFVRISGINVFVGSRELIYNIHSVVVLFLGTWATFVILKSLVTRKKTYDKAVWMNDVFYLVAIFIQGTVFVTTEVLYGKIPNITPLFRAACTAFYAFLSVKYNILNFDRLARQSLMNDIGAGFVVVSDSLDKLYANELAEELLGEYGDVAGQKHIIRQAVSQRETKLERDGVTYRVVSDVIMAAGKIDGYTILFVDITDISVLKNRDLLNEEARKNLLTNISHELRTPLNAIIGASDMISSGNPGAENYKEYAGVIRAAAMNLDDVLRDILTASSEYGDSNFDTDIAPFSICTLMDNVVEICAGRVAGRNIDFKVSVSENIPVNAVGDDKRIRQILLSVLNNSIRYTSDGSVSLHVSGEYVGEDRFQYIYTIQDTGDLVIKDDYEIERNVPAGEELGVDYSSGYSISFVVAQKIANALGGDLYAVSISEHNNIYTVRIPCRILKRTTMKDLNIRDELNLVLLGDVADRSVEFRNSCENQGISLGVYENLVQLRRLSSDEKIKVLLFDYDRFGKRVATSNRLAHYIKVAVLPAGVIPGQMYKDFIYVKEPLSALTLYKLYNEIMAKGSEDNEESRSFTAPEARILVVDDNVMNLQMATKMLEKFETTVDVCRNGYGCLEKISQGNHYNLILMDYMMEGMDGIETTAQIRKMDSPMSSVPILAYTANAVEGTREKYLSMGMNGCVYKPAGIEDFAKALREFLPSDLLVYESVPASEDRDSYRYESDFPDIEGVDKESAIRYSGGNPDLYCEMLSSFVELVDENAAKILSAQADGRYKDFAVAVHGVKGIARTVGLLGLSDRMADLENAGKAEDEAYIRKNLPGTLSFYKRYKVLLAPYVRSEGGKIGDRIPKDKVEEILIRMHNLLEDFEMDETESLLKEIWPGEYDKERAALMQGLEESIRRVDYYASKDYVNALLKTYE